MIGNYIGKTKLDDIKGAGYSYPFILATQNLEENLRTRFINLRMKLNSLGKKSDSDKSRELRINRGFSMGSKRCQYKDMAYGRGANQILDVIKSGKLNLVDFNKGKFSVEDIVSGRIDKVVKKEDIVYPIFITDLIIFMFGRKNKKIKHNDFVEFLKEKYKGDIPEEYLNNIHTVSMDVRRKIIEIMKIIPKFSLLFAEDDNKEKGSINNI